MAYLQPSLPVGGPTPIATKGQGTTLRTYQVVPIEDDDFFFKIGPGVTNAGTDQPRFGVTTDSETVMGTFEIRIFGHGGPRGPKILLDTLKVSDIVGSSGTGQIFISAGFSSAYPMYSWRVHVDGSWIGVEASMWINFGAN